MQANRTHGDGTNVAIRIPLRFEDYLEQQFSPVEPDTNCGGCGRAPAIGLSRTPNPMPFCRDCVWYQFGFDQAEAKMVRSILTNAVGAALDAGASRELVALAIEDAMAEYGGRTVEAWD